MQSQEALHCNSMEQNLLLLLHFALFRSLCFILLDTCHASSPSSDHLSLISFKSQIIQDPSHFLSSWNDSTHFCRWPGITCSAGKHPNRVTALNLDSLGLVGPISSSLANLTFLRTLHLPNNHFNGFIPPRLGDLLQLQLLNLSSNSLQGGIPSTLSLCSNLQTLSFKRNQLQGLIPPTLLQNYSALVYLDLSYNSFTGGIPDSVANLTSLSFIDFSHNAFVGSIPFSMGKLFSLRYLNLAANNLTGSIPSSAWNLSAIEEFNLHTNNLSGTLSSELGNTLPNLEKLLLYENQFSGTLPLSLSNASKLTNIEVFYNEFSGKIPPDLGRLQMLEKLILGDNHFKAVEVDDWKFFTGLVNCTNLQVLDVSYALLTGVLPDSIYNLSRKLTWLGMRGNQFHGSLTPGIANLISLTALLMPGNFLTGSIPENIGTLQRLSRLDLTGNQITGEIPIGISNLSLLNRLYLEENHLSGNIPVDLQDCHFLNLLNLGYNKLTGSIPREVLKMSSLSIYLSFSNNLLTGTLSSDIGSLTSLDAIDISNNNLSGEIPTSLGQCRSLEYIYVEGNSFHGAIPSAFGNLKGLIELDLSSNNLSGMIPQFLEDFQYLEKLNLSFNDFEGEIPNKGVFAELSVLSVLGNHKLCGGNSSLKLPPCSSTLALEKKKKKDVSVKVIAIVVSWTVCSVLILCLSAACYWKLKSRRKHMTATNEEGEGMRIPYAHLFKATNGFSESNLIGVGSFGSVYKGIMDDGKVVAVKVLNLQQRGASKSFISECEALRNIRHRNLVKILTACSSVDSKGDEFKALIFEFMSNGSLDNWLHPNMHEEFEVHPLNFIQRLSIAIDVASALDYLHNHGQTPIVHCDLKPSNVLLDNDLTAHVGDFGLSKFLDETASESSQIHAVSSGLKGTIGYVAPEYGVANKVSTEGDVFSYGILLLEMFIGKRPTDEALKGWTSIHEYVEEALDGRVMEIMDPTMFSEEGDADPDHKTSSRGDAISQECLASVLRIGLQCTHESPSERMQVGDFINELIAIKTAFFRRQSKDAERKSN